MKSIKNRKLIRAGWTFVALLISSLTLYAQDVTLPGSSSCGSSSTPGTWIVPCDVTSITVHVYGGGGGAGGGGGGSDGGINNTVGGGGAGAGGYSSTTIYVIPGSSFSYSIAQGGCGGGNGADFTNGGNGSGGGTSTFTGLDATGSPVNLTAIGGERGTGGRYSGTNGSAGTGGSASGGLINTTGAAGNNGSGRTGGLGGAASAPYGGAGGASDGGAGGLYGAGGGGGENSSGGAGGAGGILITYTVQGSIVPVVVTTPASCTAAGTATVSMYNPAITYTFTPSGPTVGLGGVISNMVSGTDYTVEAQIGLCTSASSLPFSVEDQLPSPTVSIAGVLEYCEGGNTTLTASGAQNFVWDDPAVSTTAEVTVTQGTYTVSGSDAGCAGTATVTVIEIPLPIVDLGADQVVCGQSTVTLDAGAGAGTYNWSSGDNTQTVELGAGTHWAEASNGACSASDTIVVTAVPNPQPQITPSGSLTICDAGSVTLDAGSGYASYLWQPNGETTQTITASASETYAVDVVDLAGCEGSSSTVTVTVVNVADAVITADGPLEICQGEHVLLDAGAGYDTYLWSNGAITQTTSVSSGGNYTVSGTLGGCPYASNTISISVTTFFPTISSDGTVLSVAGTYTSYQWYLNGDPIPGATSPDYNAIASGNYTIVVTDDSGCAGRSAILEYTLPPTSGIGEAEADQPFSVYPNPNNGHFQIEMDMNVPYTIEVSNMMGQLVQTQKNVSGNRSSIDIASNGMYLLRVTVEDRTYHKRVIVQ